ncbi:hypothetical protein BJ944DRAFT_265401 [Cunninghamella echinulata]|nr:hypothetical protein BJ944DRAFT_265401 [Cunninghamella echinulata]
MATISLLKQKRRVSFDLEHTTIHVLPTDKQIKEYADRLRREAYQNRTLNQELLDDSIVSEIAEACTCSSRQDTSSNEVCLKSCLKIPTPVYSQPKQQPTRKSKKKARRHSRASSRRFENETQGMISVF